MARVIARVSQAVGEGSSSSERHVYYHLSNPDSRILYETVFGWLREFLNERGVTLRFVIYRHWISLCQRAVTEGNPFYPFLEAYAERESMTEDANIFQCNRSRELMGQDPPDITEQAFKLSLAFLFPKA